MSRDNTDAATFDPDFFPEVDTDDYGVAIGFNSGRRQRAEGAPEVAAVWEAAPVGCRIGGAVWELIRRGVAAAYAEPRR